MAPSAALQRLERVEKFLDSIDKVTTPNDLQEPFRSLWLRAHGEKPTLMSDERQEAMLSGGFSQELFGDVEISSAEKRPDSKGSIEFISPKDVGPTIEMEVEENKVTFKMAADKDLKNIEAKEKAANGMIELQNHIKPLSGLGGEVAKVCEGITDIARDYKDGNFGKAMDLSRILKKKVDTDDFRRSVVVELQKKIGEYSELGGDTTKAKDKFKELAISLKDGDQDFILIAGDVNALAEYAIKDIVEEEVIVQVKGAHEEKEAPKTKRTLKRKIVQKLPEKTEEKEAPKEEKIILDEEEGPDPVEEDKPVIKIVTVKKLVPVQKVRKERKEYRKQIKKDIPKDKPKVELEKDETPEKPIVKEETVEEEISAPEVEPEAEVREIKKEKAPMEKAEHEASADGTPVGSIQNAYKKYQFVYNASIKMNEAGKDVSQIFDLMTFAEQARQKGEMKTYVGVCNQMETMLIQIQTKG